MTLRLAAEIILGLSAAALFYTYAGYPLLLVIASTLRPKRVRRDRFETTVTIIITAYNEERALAAKLEAGGENLHNRSRQHKSRAQGYEILEVGAIPVPLDYDGAPKNIGCRRRKAEQNAEENGMHAPEDNTSSPLPVLPSQLCCRPDGGDQAVQHFA